MASDSDRAWRAALSSASRAARCLVSLAVLATLSGVAAVSAQPAYPTKSIKLIVPFGPGGPTDVAARIASEIIQGALGQSVVIENRPGAGGGTGTRAAAQAEPDGYTLLIGTAATLGVVPALSKTAGFDPVTSLAAVAKLTDSTIVLVTPADFPATTLAAFIAYAKEHPGKLNYASAGVGNLTQLNAELFKAKAGIEVVHVPYKSGSEMVTALLGGQVQMAFPDISILLPLIEEKKLRALAVTSATRHAALPDVPTMTESGLLDFVTPFWTGLMAPAPTPSVIVTRLNAAIVEGLGTARMRELLAKVGAVPAPMSAPEYAAFVAAEADKWRGVVKLAGINPE